jgi:inorganic pyrophosphatase/exopolyphosphatase
MTAVIISYINPDLDGVACSIALEALERPQWAARVLGRADRETQFVLDALSLSLPPSLDNWNGVEAIWLVDTHHPKQLSEDLPASRVTRITDHHPGGSPQNYANAEIQNEAVGAAATLVTERFEQHGVDVPSKIAVLLQAAIVSNTLDFSAPATNDRDRGAHERLARIKPIDAHMIDGMRQIRREKVMLDTDALLNSDAKIFDTPHGRVVIAQVEAPGALQILSRTDLMPALKRFATARNAASALLNLVDTEAGKSAILGTDERILGLVSAGLRQQVDGQTMVRADRVLQRKTDIIPFIAA